MAGILAGINGADGKAANMVTGYILHALNENLILITGTPGAVQNLCYGFGLILFHSLGGAPDRLTQRRCIRK